MGDSHTLLTQRHGHVVILTLNRPDRLNALDDELAAALHDSFDAIEAGFPDDRVLVLTGNGRGFCSGADVNRLAASVRGELRESPPKRPIRELAPRLRELPQPVIAAVNGVAAGAGLALALASDIRIASTEARFASVFVKRALVPDSGTTYTLERVAGPGVAAEMSLTGRVVDALFAERVGLVNRLVEPQALLDEALAIATEIAGNPPLAVQHTKWLMDRAGADIAEIERREAEVNLRYRDSHDRREAVFAFLEKRPPVFTGT